MPAACAAEAVEEEGVVKQPREVRVRLATANPFCTGSAATRCCEVISSTGVQVRLPLSCTLPTGNGCWVVLQGTTGSVFVELPFSLHGSSCASTLCAPCTLHVLAAVSGPLLQHHASCQQTTGCKAFQEEVLVFFANISSWVTDLMAFPRPCGSPCGASLSAPWLR